MGTERTFMQNTDVLIVSAWTCLNQFYRKFWKNKNILQHLLYLLCSKLQQVAKLCYWKTETQMCLNMGRLQVLMVFSDLSVSKEHGVFDSFR